MKIGIIDNYDSFVYNLVRYVRENEDVDVVVQRNNQIDYSVLDECDAILLSPGPGIPSEAGDLLKVITKYTNSKKILGICLGHQAIAESFGGKLVQCANPLHGKSSVMKIENFETIFKGIQQHTQIGRYHSWVIEMDHVSELKKTGVTDHSVMAFQHVSLPIYGLQFHPESILTPEGRIMIKNWLSL